MVRHTYQYQVATTAVVFWENVTSLQVSGKKVQFEQLSGATIQQISSENFLSETFKEL